MDRTKPKILNDLLLIALALVSLGLLVYELVGNPSPELLEMIHTVDLGIALVFGLEFVVRLFLAKNRKKFMRENWWQILASIPVTTSSTQALRGLMLLRLARIARATSVAARISLFSRSLAGFIKKTRLAWVITLLGVALVSGSVAFHHFERPVNPSINNFFDSFWFISSSMTNTGTGSVDPITSGGRTVAIASMFSGVIIFGLFVAFIASYLVYSRNKKTR